MAAVSSLLVGTRFLEECVYQLTV